MLDHFKLVAPFYDRVIRPPDIGHLKQVLNLPVQGSLLDVGGGTGRVSAQLRPFVDDLILTDLSSDMLRQAKGKGTMLMALATAERLPFSAESFDRILVVDSLHHFSDQHEAITELLRVLKPRGRLVIEEPDINHMAVKIIAFLEKLTLMDTHFYTPREIAEIIANHGLSSAMNTNSNLNAWIIVDK